MAGMTVHALLCERLPPDLAAIVTDYVIRKDWTEAKNRIKHVFRHVEWEDDGEPTRVRELMQYVNMMESPVWCYDDHVGFKIERKVKPRERCTIS